MFNNFSFFKLVELPQQLDFTIDLALLLITGLIVTITCLKLICSSNLLHSIIILSVFSIMISLCYLLLDAPDVAMTETALGAALSSCVMLNLIKIFGEKAKQAKILRLSLATVLSLALIAILTWASLDLPEFGNPDTPLQTHVNKYYLENTHQDIAIPSIVAAILASYRGFDTLGEATVILIAAIGVLLILSSRRGKNA